VRPAPRAICIDEVSIARHTYRIVVSDLDRRRLILGRDRSEASLDLFYQCLGTAENNRLRLAMTDPWKLFRNATRRHDTQASPGNRTRGYADVHH
jgi:hypothetical protein